MRWCKRDMRMDIVCHVLDSTCAYNAFLGARDGEAERGATLLLRCKRRCGEGRMRTMMWTHLDAMTSFYQPAIDKAFVSPIPHT